MEGMGDRSKENYI